VEMKERIRRPGHVINIKRIPELDYFDFDDESGLRFGATVTARRLEVAPLIRQKYAGLWAAVRELGSIQIRNRATVVGNICRASPSADTPPPMMADEARTQIFGPSGAREVALEDFFTGPGQTILAPDEVVTGITIPTPRPHTGKAYLKHGRRAAMELATVGVAARLTRDGDVPRQVRLVLGAVAPTPIRAREAEAVLDGQRWSARLVEEAAETARLAARPIGDVRASREYRSQMVAVLTRRALLQAWEAAA
jgi:carbon-monoxide dehydrogenase medium subunit